jgi:hypothetical protein
MAGLRRLALPASLVAATGRLLLSARGLFLMRRVRMVLGLEMLRLMLGAFATLRHESSEFGCENWLDGSNASMIHGSR